MKVLAKNERVLQRMSNTAKSRYREKLQIFGLTIEDDPYIPENHRSTLLLVPGAEVWKNDWLCDFCEYEWFHYSCVGNHEEMRVRVVSLFLCRKPRGNASTSGFTILVSETTRKMVL